MQVSGDKRWCPEDGVGRPSVPMEDPYPVSDHPGGGMHRHFSGQPARQPHVVVSQHDFDGMAFFQEAPEELEQQWTERGWGSDDRVLHVAGDHEMVDRRTVEHTQRPFRQPVGRSLGRTSRPVRERAEAQMEVGDDDQGVVVLSRATDPERGSLPNRLKS
jgi:hypothetical protein